MPFGPAESVRMEKRALIHTQREASASTLNVWSGSAIPEPNTQGGRRGGSILTGVWTRFPKSWRKSQETTSLECPTGWPAERWLSPRWPGSAAPRQALPYWIPYVQRRPSTFLSPPDFCSKGFSFSGILCRLELHLNFFFNEVESIAPTWKVRSKYELQRPR